VAQIVVRCVHGVEWVAAAEVERLLGPTDIALARREITFTLPDVDRRLRQLRCADDAFRHVGNVHSVGSTSADLPALARAVAALPWPTPRPDATTFDCVASIEGRRSYPRTAVEDAVGAHLAGVLRLRYRSRASGSGASGDVTVRLFLHGPMAAVALRIPPTPLHRRPWKLATGLGTLHPPLAAAIVAMTTGARVHDPFCGDGTLAVEAALAGRRASAADLDPARVANTRANAARAGATVDVRQADAGSVGALGRVDVLLTNPPWSRTVGAGGMVRAAPGRFWSDAARVARQLAVLSDADLDVPAQLRERGFAIGLATRVRLAGRLAHVTLAAAPGKPPPPLPADLARWRERALQAGVVTEEGF